MICDMCFGWRILWNTGCARCRLKFSHHIPQQSSLESTPKSQTGLQASRLNDDSKKTLISLRLSRT